MLDSHGSLHTLPNGNFTNSENRTTISADLEQQCSQRYYILKIT